MSINLGNQGEYMRSEVRRAYFEMALVPKINLFRVLCETLASGYYRDPSVCHVHFYYFHTNYEGNCFTQQGMQLFLIYHFAQGYCIANPFRKVQFCFYNLENDNFESLKQKVALFSNTCSMMYTCKKCRVLDHIQNESRDFYAMLSDDEVKKTFKNPYEGKLVLFDQLTFTKNDKLIIEALIDSPKTDVWFIVTDATIDRFKHSELGKKVKIMLTKNLLEDAKAYHNEIAQYIKSLIPSSREYFLHLFSQQQGSSFYGIILGTASVGNIIMFLNACWKQDPYEGESNIFQLIGAEDRFLLNSSGLSRKQQQIKKEFVEMVLEGKITDQLSSVKYAISRACDFNFVHMLTEELLEKGKIEIRGNLNIKYRFRYQMNGYSIQVA